MGCHWGSLWNHPFHPPPPGKAYTSDKPELIRLVAAARSTAGIPECPRTLTCTIGVVLTSCGFHHFLAEWKKKRVSYTVSKMPSFIFFPIPFTIPSNQQQLVMVPSNEGIWASASLLARVRKASQVCIWHCWWNAAGSTRDFQMTMEVEMWGWSLQAWLSGPWSHMHWEAHLPFLDQRVTFDQELPEGKTNKQTMIHRDGDIFSLEMIIRKRIWMNEWS